jgi:hypothetical protein
MLKVVHDREIDYILGAKKVCACFEYHVQDFHLMIEGQNFTYVMDGLKYLCNLPLVARVIDVNWIHI